MTDFGGPSPSCSTEPQPTLSLGPGGNHGDQGQDIDYPGGLDSFSETPRFNIVVKEEEEDLEEWSFNYTGESPNPSSSIQGGSQQQEATSVDVPPIGLVLTKTSRLNPQL
ncbi:hypothetical protein J4Q44_G00291650 [Coregonus suidteri]|uniref:Uncharacterized protein n=1 Tax=Coregonus suidteri TaxID=861788 RepID=A0AAN8KY78_9TELE